MSVSISVTNVISSAFQLQQKLQKFDNLSDDAEHLVNELEVFYTTLNTWDNILTHVEECNRYLVNCHDLCLTLEHHHELGSYTIDLLVIGTTRMLATCRMLILIEILGDHCTIRNPY
jgi:hypothetical protein